MEDDLRPGECSIAVSIVNYLVDGNNQFQAERVYAAIKFYISKYFYVVDSNVYIQSTLLKVFTCS